ncbi:MAG: cupin domain-containing protein [Salinirussus sp.]
MEYHVVDPGEIDATPDYPCGRRSVSDSLDLSALAAAVYELDPGEQLPRSYHYHEQREELFYVAAGVLHVETPTGEFVVEPGELFVATPGSPHRPHSPASADETVRVLGVGAPKVDVGRPFDPETDVPPSERS